jgi:hypothetical protein
MGVGPHPRPECRTEIRCSNTTEEVRRSGRMARTADEDLAISYACSASRSDAAWDRWYRRVRDFGAVAGVAKLS